MRVEVIISTYNGAEYLEEQIASILNQENVDTHITVRDDGSTDSTLDILNAQCKKYPGRISLIKGNNIGYRKSFLFGLKESESADYYAFSDQDDIWLPNKLSKAVENLNKLNSDIKLYVSSLKITDRYLNEIGVNDISNMTNSLRCYFARPRLAGCTYVFNKSLKDAAIKLFELLIDDGINDISFPDHDFVVGAIGFACGEVYIDKDSFILHRRLSSSITGGGNGIRKRIQTEYKCFFARKKVRSLISEYLLSSFKEHLRPDVMDFLIATSVYNRSLPGKRKLMKYKGFSSNIPVCDIETRLCILLGVF